MLNKYDVLDKIATIGGILGQTLVWAGMIAFCGLLWYFVIGLAI